MVRRLDASSSSSSTQALAPQAGAAGRLDRHSLTIAIASVLGATLPTWASAQTTITLDTDVGTRTSTTVTTTGAVHTVNTATTSGANAFNSFNVFRVGAGDTVNLHLPAGTSNLINLVWDEQVSINGLLNSYKGAGTTTVGGRVFFAAPNGFVVGSTGVLNVGALSVATPRVDEMLRLGAEMAGVGTGAFEELLKGELKNGSGNVRIDGRVNARDDVRIQAHAIDVSGVLFVEGGTGVDKLDSAIAVNTGGTGATDGVRLVNDGNNIILVGDDRVNVAESGTLRANGGDVLLQANATQNILKETVDRGAVTVDGAINTRRTAAGQVNPASTVASTGASGNVLITGKDLVINGTVDASADGGRTAGDIDVQARAHDGAKFGWVKAESSATVDGALTGRNVSVTAESTATSVWDFEKDINGVEVLPTLAIESVTGVLGMAGVFDVGLLSATTKATVDIASGAVLTAADDVTVQAKTLEQVETKAATRGNGLNQPIASISASYGKIDAEATVNVASGARLEAGTNVGDNVAIRALTDNTLAVSSLVLTTGVQPAAASVAVSEINVDSNVTVASGVVIKGDAVEIRATNENSFETTARATSDKDGVAGMAGAVSLQDVNASATSNASMSDIGSLTIDATNHTSVNLTGAKVAVGKDGLMMALQQKKADMELALLSRLGSSLGGANGIIGKQSSGGGETKPFRVGGAVSVAEASHTATAKLGDNASIATRGAGDVTINAKVRDEGISQQANSAVASKAKDENGADYSLSFAVSYGKYNHDAKATVGRGASITADEISVLSAVELPLGITRSELQDIPKFFEQLEDYALAKINPGDQGESEELDTLDLSNPLTSMVSAKSKGEKVGLSGAVNYMEVANTSSAWVDDGATLTARNVNVKALTDIVSVHLAGKPGAADGGRGAAGGTFSDVIHANATRSGIGADTVVTASNAVDVAANSNNTTYIVAPTSGSSDTLGLTGMVSISDVDDLTHASISNDAQVTAKTVDVTAAQEMLLVSAAGGFTKSESAAVGFTVAVNNLSSDTHAYVGDNSADSREVTGRTRAATANDGFIATDTLDVKADTSGQSIAIAVAGSLAKNDDPNAEKGKPGVIDKIKGSVDSAKKKVDDASKKIINELGALDKLSAKVAGGGGAAPLAGAASVAPAMGGSSQALLMDGPGMSDPNPASAGGPGMSNPLPPNGGAPSMSDPTPPAGDAATMSKPAPPMSGAASTAAAGADPEPKPQPKFGLSVSGSAAVNMAAQSTRATLDGATVKARTTGGMVSTTVQATNAAMLASASGAAAITMSKAPSSKFNGAMAGAVAYGLIDNTTEASATNSTLQDADDVAVRALNVGEHVVLGISVGVEASGTSTKSASFSGSFSVAQTENDTLAVFDNTTVQGANASAGSSVDLTAYNRSRTGIGAGALYVNLGTGSNANLGMAFTYAKVGGSTEAAMHDGRISNIDAVAIRAVDSALIGSAAAMGGGGPNANGIAGAFVWNEIANTTRATVDGGAEIEIEGDIAVSARASAPVAALDALVTGGVTDKAEYDYSGTTLQTNKGETGLPGTAIVSVAGAVQVGKNNVGVSFVGSKVDNTHEVSIDGATLDAGTKKVDLKATDDTRIISVSVGVGAAKGEFAGLGSATANMIGNTDRVLVNNSRITAGSIEALAQDTSKIESLAGNVTVSKGSAAGVAITYNDISNTVEAAARGSTLDTKGEGAAGANGTIKFTAKSDADILAGAVAGAVSKEVAIGGSFGWSETDNTTNAEVGTSTVSTGSLEVDADNDSSIRTLAGSIAVSKDAAFGAAINSVLIGDSATALLDRVALDATGAVNVDAGSKGAAESMAVAGAAATNVALSGSNNNAAITNTVRAQAHGLTGTSGAAAKTLSVTANNQMDIDTLAGAIAGSQYAAVGGAIGVNLVGGTTSATLTESQLAVTDAVTIDADSKATIDTLSIAASGSAQGAFSGAVTTNNISSTVEAGVRDSGSNNTTHTLSVTADDASRIASLAGSAAVAGNAGVGASIAVNRIATTVDAFIEGGDNGRAYKAGDVTVAATGATPAADNSANIRTIAIGVGGGGDVGGAGSLAVNLMDNDVKARIDTGAKVASENNVAVLAHNKQGIEVLAGAAAFGGSAAGVGVGVVVNNIDGETAATIAGATTQVDAFAKGAGRTVSSGELANPAAVDVSNVSSVSSYSAPNLSTSTRSVNGVAVNATNLQHIGTVGVGLGFSASPTSVAASGMAGINVIGGTTRAAIDSAKINTTTGAAVDQQVDVRAGSHAMNANFIVGVAAGGGVAGTAAIASNTFKQDTEASITNATTRATSGVTVDSNASHNAVALSVGLAAGLGGGAGSASVNIFDTRSRAFVLGGTLNASSLLVDADTTNRVSLISGAGGFGGVGIAGSFLINIGSSETDAYIGGADRTTGVTTGGATEVDATSTSVMKGVAVTAAGGGEGYAGMAGVSVLANATRAYVRNSTLGAGTVDVGAKESLDLSSYAGALGVGLAGNGVGAAANVAVLSGTTSADIIGSTVNATGNVTVEALSQRKIDAITVTAGGGTSAGIGGAASLLLVGLGDRGQSGDELNKGGSGTLSKAASLATGTRADASITGDTLSASERTSVNTRSAFDITSALGGAVDGTFAGVTGSTITTSGALEVDADSQLGMRHVTGALGVGGGIGIGGALAYSGVYDTTGAVIDTASTVTARGGIDVTADSGDYDPGATGEFRSGDARAYAGGASLLAGLGAALAIANVDRSTTASAGGTLKGNTTAAGTLEVRAADTSTVKSDAVGASIGSLAVGVVVSTASKRSAVEAHIKTNQTTPTAISEVQGVVVDARSTGAVTATGTGASAGLVAAATGVGVTANDETDVLASIGSKVNLTVGAAGTKVNALATPQLRAEALGATVGGNAGIGASVALAHSDTDVQAKVGDDATINGSAGLDVEASVTRATTDTDSAFAKSIAGSGGVLLGANASVAEAKNTSKSTASTGARVRLSTGNINVDADIDTRQTADATGIAIGALALGASVANATSTTTTSAQIGTSNLSSGGTVGDVRVNADATDRNIANSTAGAGGVVSGNASRADTNASATTSAGIGASTVLTARTVDVAATHDSRYAGQADSLNASVVGVSGAGIGHTANSTVNATLGNNVNLSTIGDTRVAAQNQFHGDTVGASVKAAGGGVINGSAALVDVDLTGISNATVGTGARIATGLTTGTNGRAGDIHVISSTIAQTGESADLSTGGAIDVAVVKAESTGTFTNNATIGNNAAFNTFGYINVGTYTQASLGATALVNTWGLAAVGVSDADVDIVSNQNVSVGTGATLEAFRNVYITAGRDSRNLQDTRLEVDSTAQGYVRGLIAIPASSASGHTTSNASTTIATDTQVISANNITTGSYTGSETQRVDGTGHGYQLGFIPVTQRDSDAGSGGTGTVTLNGALTAGRYNTLKIDIDASGALTQSEGITVDRSYNASFNPRTFLDGLSGSCATDASDGCKALAALKGSVANSAIGAWSIGPMFAAGGDVFLHGDAIAGSGAATAKGAPSITVTNRSNRALLLDEINLPDYGGGNVRFTGTASTAGNVVLTQAPAAVKPTVTLQNLGTAKDPGAPMFAMGDIRNLGGLVRMTNSEGSLGLFATVYAQQQIIEAPNGIVTFNNISRDFPSGSNPRSDWLGWGRPGNPNEVVAYITNDHFDASGTGLIYRAGNSSYAGASVLPWSNCLPHNNNSCGAGQYPFGHLDFAYDGGNGNIDMPNTPFRSLYRSANYADNASVANNAANSSFIGQQIYVRARYIDVNSTIDAGAGTNWSLRVKPELQTWINALGGAQGVYDIPAGYLEAVDGSSRLIKAHYDATNKRVVVDDVNASGGGYVYLDGRIVSSTPHGKIKVSSGFGKVTVDNQAPVAVELGDINVGNGAVGVVEIVDREKNFVYGNPYTTWYVSRQGEGTRAYDNSNGASSYDTGVGLANTGTYNPTAGMRFGWTDTARVGRADASSQWSWVDSSGLRVDDGQQWSVSDGGYYRGTAGGPAFEQNYSGVFTSISYQGISYGCDNQYGGCNYSFPAISGGNQWNPGRNDGDGGWQTAWLYARPTQGTLTLNNSVKADNAIAIDFSGNALGSVDVKAQGNLFVNGRIRNSGGNTTLTTTATGTGGIGHVTQTGDIATVTTRSLKVNSAGGLGTSSKMFDVTLTDGGSLDASTTGWGQYVRLLSGGAVRMLDSGYGNVVLDANGSITGINGATRDITGGSITLTSRFGSLGTLADPLALDSREISFWGFKFGGRVNASALGDIALTDHSGDFAVDKVVSETGNVRLEAAAGNLIDARERVGGGTLDESQRQAIWGTLKLDGSGVAASVAAYEKQIVTRYNEYWRLLDVGSVSGGTYTLGANAIALYRPLAEAAAGRTGLTEAEVNTYAAGRFNETTSAFDGAFGSNWRSQSAFQARTAAFTYTVDVNSAQYAELSKNSTWTQGQLKYAINANALEPASGAVGMADPNVVGRNVTLIASSNVGRLAADMNIGYTSLVTGTLNDDQAIALALANAPGDVVLVRGDGHVYSRAELLALTPAEIAAGAVANVRVKQTSPLFVQMTGKLNGSAGQAAFLQANGDLAVERFTTQTDARIAATGAITSSRTDTSHTLRVGGDLVLLAGNGRIAGSTSSGNTDALITSIGGRLLSASAGQDVRLRDDDGDLHLGTVFANGTIGLESRNGALVSVFDGVTLDGQSIELKAAGDIGHRKAATGALEGALKLRTAPTGTLAGNAGGNAWIDSPDRDLHVGTFTAGGDLRVTASTGDLTVDNATAGDELVLGAGEDLVVTQARGLDSSLTAVGDVTVGTLDSRAAVLNAGTALRIGTVRATGAATLDSGTATTVDAAGLVRAASVDLDAATLTMGAGSRIEASGDIAIDTTGNMVLGAVALTGNVAGSDISLTTPGRIDGNGDGQVNITGGSNNALSMQAGTGIGTAARPLAIDIGRSSGRVPTGDIHLRLPNGGRIDSLITDTGAIGLGAGGQLDIGLVQAATALRIDGRDVTATTLSSGTQTGIAATGDVIINAATAGTDFAVNSGGLTSINGLTVARDAALTSGAALTVSTADVGGTLGARAGTTLEFRDARVAGVAKLDAGQDIRLGTTRFGATLDADAGRDLIAGQLDVAGTTLLDAVQDLRITRATIGGDLTADAGRNLAIETLDARGNATLDAGADLGLVNATVARALRTTSGAATAFGDVRVGEMLDTRAGTTLDAGTLVVGGNATTASGGATTVDTLDVTGALLANSGDALAVNIARVGGNATLDATGSIDLNDATIGGNLDADAGTSFDAALLAVTGNALLRSGTSTRLGSAAIGGDLDADAGTTIDADLLRVTGNALLVSGTRTTLRDAAIEGDLDADAGTDLIVTTLDVGGNAALDTGQAIRLTTATVDGNLLANAGTTLDATTLAVGGNATTTSGGSTTIDTLDVGGALAATSGDNLTINIARVDGNATLDATNAIDLNDATIGGNLDADAGTSFDAALLAVTGDALLRSGTSTRLGSASIGGDLDVGAGTTIDADLLRVSGSALLVSGTSTTLRDAAIEGDLKAEAGTDLIVTTLDVGGDADLDAGQAIRLTTANIDGNLLADAGTTLDATTLNVGRNATTTSGGTTTIDTLGVGGNLVASAGDNLTLNVSRVGGNATLDAVNAIDLNDATIGGNLDAEAGTTLDAALLKVTGNALLLSGTSTTLGNATIGGDLDAEAGTDFIATTLKVGGNGDIDAGEAIRLTTATVDGNLLATAGTTLDAQTLTVGLNATTTSGGDTTIDTLTVGGDLIANAGDNLTLDVSRITGNATLDASNAIVLNDATVGGNLDADAGTTLDAALLKVTGNALLLSGTTTTLVDATIGGDLDAQAGTDFIATTLKVGGNGDIDTGEAIRLTTATIDGNLRANAGTTLDAGTLTVGRNATTTSGGNTTIDLLTVGGNLAATAGDNLSIDVSRITGDATLDAFNAIVLNDAKVGGNLDANAGTTLDADLLHVVGNALVASGGTTTLNTARIDGNLDATAGADFRATRLDVAGTADIVAARDVLLTTATVQGDLTGMAGRDVLVDTLNGGSNATLDAGHDLRITTGTIAGALRTGSGAATRFDDVRVGGTLDANAGTTLDARLLSVGADATTRSGGNTTIDTLDVGGALAATAGDTLSLKVSRITGNATLDATNAIVLDDARIGGNLDADAGTTLDARVLSVAGNALLKSGSTTTLGTATIGGNLDADAGTDFVGTTLDVAGDAAFGAGQAIRLATATVDGNLRASAGTTLDAQTLSVGGDATTASTGNTTIGTLDVEGSLQATSGETIAITTLDVGVDALLRAGRDVVVTTATTGRDFSAYAGRDIDIGTLDVGRDALLDAGRSLRLGTARIGNSLTLRTGEAMSLGSLDIRGDFGAYAGTTLDATRLFVGGNANLGAGGNVTVGTLDVGRNLLANAGGTLSIDAMRVGGNAGLTAGRDILLGTATVSGSLDAKAGNDLVVGTLDVGGAAALDAGNDVRITRATIGGDLAAKAGRDIDIATLDARRNATLTAGNALRVVDGTVTGSLLSNSGTSTTVSTLTVGADLDAIAGTTLDANTLVVGGDATTRSGGTTTIGTLDVTGALDARSGDALMIDTARIGGDATLDARSAITLDTATVGGNFDAKAGTTFDARALTVAGNALLHSGTTTTLGTAAIEGDLVADAGTDLVASELSVGGAATLSAGNDVRLTRASIAGELAIDATRDIAIEALDAGANARLDAGNALRIDTGTIGGALRTTSTMATNFGTVSTGGDLVGSAGTALFADALFVGGNATTRSVGTTAIGALDVTGALDAGSGTDLSISRASVGNGANLEAAQSIALGSMRVGGDLAANAGTDLAAREIAVSGNTTLDAGQSITLGLADVGGSLETTSGTSTTFDRLIVGEALDATAGTDITAGEIAAGRDAHLVAGNDVRIARGGIGGHLGVDAGGDVSMSSLRVGGNAALAAGHDLALDDARIAGTLTASAANALGTDRLNVGGDADLDARMLAIGVADVRGTVRIEAGEDLDVALLSTGGTAALAAGNDATIGTLRSDAAIEVRAGDALAATTLSSAAGITLAARDIAVANATVGGALDARSSQALRLDAARVTGETTLRAGTQMALGSIAGTGDIDAAAAGALQFGQLDGGRDITVASSGGNVDGGNATAARNLRMAVAGTVDFAALKAGGDASLVAGTAIDGDVLRAAGDVSARAGTDLALRDVEGRGLNLDAGNGIRVERAKASTDLAFTAGANVDGGTLVAARNLSLRSRNGDVDGDALTSGGSLTLNAARDVRVDQANSGTGLVANAGRDMSMGRYDAAGTVALQSTRDMRISDGRSTGAQSLLVGGSLDFGQLRSAAGINAEASGGRIDGDMLDAANATVSARDAIALDMARIGSHLNMASQSIDADVVHAGTGTFTARLTGYREGVARRIDLSVDARDGWLVERLAAMQAALDTTAANVELREAEVTQTLSLATPVATIWMDNGSARLANVDVQLIELDKRFMLRQTGTHTFTDAFVLRFSPGFQVEVPNYNAGRTWSGLSYMGESVLRHAVRTLAADDLLPNGQREEAVVIDPLAPVEGGAAVNIGATPQ